MRLLFISLVLISIVSNGQPFRDEIDEFLREDSIKPPPTKAILFVGSSSLALWKDIQADFPQHEIINRGFGGSTLEDVLRYANEIILPYNPRQVFVYCGENDLADGTSPEVVVSRFKQLFNIIRKASSSTVITFISMKPSPSRAHILKEIKQANEMVRNFLSQEKKSSFVDVFTLMVDKKGNPREELFVEDSLHMNRTGYDIWKKAILPYMK